MRGSHRPHNSHHQSLVFSVISYTAATTRNLEHRRNPKEILIPMSRPSHSPCSPAPDNHRSTSCLGTCLSGHLACMESRSAWPLCLLLSLSVVFSGSPMRRMLVLCLFLLHRWAQSFIPSLVGGHPGLAAGRRRHEIRTQGCDMLSALTGVHWGWAGCLVWRGIGLW